MITHACVAIQLLGAPAAPDAVQALQQRCDGILGAGECRLAGDATGAAGGDSACWLATVARTDDDGAASVVVSALAAPKHIAHRDLVFQARDARTDRWATLGLVIAALVTMEEHSATGAAPAADPAPPKPAAPWFSRDPAAPMLQAVPAPPAHTLPRVTDLRVLAVSDLGRLPWATLGARLATTLQIARYFDVQAGGAYLASTSTATVSLASGGTGGGRFSLWSATLGLCPHPQLALPLTGHVCVGVDETATMASGVGVAEAAHQTVWGTAAWLGFDTELHLTRHVAVVLEYKTEVALNRPVYVLEYGSPVYQPSRLSQNLGLGVAATF